VKQHPDECDLLAAGKLPKDPMVGTKVVNLPGCFPFTDYGNAERICAMARHRIRYSPQRRKWLIFRGSRWVWDETGEIDLIAKEMARSIYTEAGNCPDAELRKAMAQHARKTEDASKLQAAIKLARTERGIPVLVRDLDADPWLLNCANGTVDLRTGSLKEHDRSDLITKTTGVDFNPKAKSELWDRVLRDATGGDSDLGSYLQRVAGYSLIGEPLERAFFFIYGPPGTSKSTLVRALHAALGDYAISAAFETFCIQTATGGNRGDLVRLAGARLVSSVEARKGARWDEALLKALTGGDLLVACAKFESEIEFLPACTLITVANESPQARDDDEGLWTRIRRIPLSAIVPEDRQDRDLKNKLAQPEHARAILAWAVAGCLAYQRDGLAEPAAVRDSTAAYRAEQDRFGEFTGDALVFEPDARVTRKELRAAYESWGKEVGARSLLGARDIAQRLRARGCEEKTVRGSRQWVGVRLRTIGDSDEVQPGAHGVQFTHRHQDQNSHVGPSGSDAPKCTPAPQVQLFDDPDEREAIQAEAGE
jgi:putative DNA primase/helicase